MLLQVEKNTVHALVHLAISAPDAETLPVLVEYGGEGAPRFCASVMQYARYLQREGLASYDLIEKDCRVLGKLFDYYVLERDEKELFPGELRTLLDDFLFAYDHGAVLGWESASNAQYKSGRRAVAGYVKFVMDTGGALWTQLEQKFVAACRESYRSLNKAQETLLFHTKKRSVKKTRGRKKNRVGLRQFKPFPPGLVQALIDETDNERDKLFFASMAYGGRRGSEILQTFMQDYSINSDGLTIYLRHPTTSSMTWFNKAHQKVSGERRLYLRSMFDLLPRTEHGKLKTAAGWKGIKFDDEALQESQVYWIGNGGAYCAALYQTYLHGPRSRAQRRQHPYFYVNGDGRVMTMAAIRKQFCLAKRRLEKKYGVSLAGYGIHSLRHYYGYYCADVLKQDLLWIQKWMGHIHLSSTAIYAHITPGTANAAIKQAHENAIKKGTEMPTSEERAEIAAQFAEVEATQRAPAIPPPHAFGFIGKRAAGLHLTRATGERR